MTSKVMACSGILLAAGFLFTSSVSAMDMGKMMNPMKWMKGSKNDDDYYDDRYGGPGYGYGGPGYGGGYGAPGYGGYGAPGYGGAPAYNAPQTGSGPDAGEISRLKERIRVLEEGNREIPAPSSYGGQQGYQQAPSYGTGTQPGYGGQPGYQQAPAYGNPNSQFRPMDRK